ncbi:MAG: flagellar motor switch protein FliG [Pseudomonadota bacterium]|jgi:flagellar motor switch protein FliG|nr:flagellar motor switch protein FliG [Alphaproteobacteria bacterium]
MENELQGIMEEKSTFSGSERAAIMMFSLPEEQAQKIFKYLDLVEVKDLSQAMASLGTVNAQTVESLCAEFVNEIASYSSLVGTIESTRRLLSKFMSPDEVDRIIEDIRGPTGRNMWDKLSSVDEEMLAGYLKNESPQTIAVILSRIRAETSAKVLSYLPEAMADDVVMRLLRLDTVRREVLEEIESSLHKEFISTLGRSLKKDPYEMVAEVFNNLDRASETRLLNNLEQKKPEIAEKIRNLMFTFEDLGQLDKTSIIALLRSVDRSKLAIALKGTQERIKDKFLKNMSERSSKLLLDEMNVLGLVRLKDVEKAQNEIIAVAKDMAARNEINIFNNSENGDQLVE